MYADQAQTFQCRKKTDFDEIYFFYDFSSFFQLEFAWILMDFGTFS